MQLRTSEKGTNLLTQPESQEIKRSRNVSEGRFDGLGTQGPFRLPLFRLQRRALPVEDIKNPLRFLLEKKKRCMFTSQQWKRIWEASKSAACRSNLLQRGLQTSCYAALAMSFNHWAPPASPCILNPLKSAPFHLKVNTVATASSNKSTIVWAVATRIRTLQPRSYPLHLVFVIFFNVKVVH